MDRGEGETFESKGGRQTLRHPSRLRGLKDAVILTREKLRVEEEEEEEEGESGAKCIFLGKVRSDISGSSKVVKLFYEAYEAMARKEILKICSEIRLKWEEIHRIRVCHRLGDVAVGEAGVLISVSSKRRRPALEATDYAIENLKLRVPIWKKEFYDDGTAMWKENTPSGGTSDSKDLSKTVQITASNGEINRRINSFIERKRLEVDKINSLEFCNRHHTDFNEHSCARTDSVLIPRQGSSSHYSKSRVINDVAAKDESPFTGSCLSGAEERLKNLEEHLVIEKPVGKDVFQRIKALEDRVLYLESLSPEYFSNSGGNKTNENKDDKDALSREKVRIDLTNSLKGTNLRIYELQRAIQTKQEPPDKDFDN